MLVTYLYALPLWFVSLDMVLGILLWGHHASQKLKKWQTANALLIAVAVFGVLWVTLLNRRGPVESYVVLEPFHSLEVAKVQPEMYRELLMNGLLFYPLGLTLSNTWPRKWKTGLRVGLTVAVGMLLSIGVEYTQYRFSMGVSETDDVITNTLGTFIGASNLLVGDWMARARLRRRMRVSVPEGLLLESLGAAVRGEKLVKDEPVEPEDFRRFLELAGKHHVLPLVYEASFESAAACRAIAEAGDERWPAFYKAASVQQVLSQSVRTEAFLKLYARLAEAGFHPLVVKGLSCRELYPCGDYRASSDEDLLVPEAEFEPLCAFLSAEGLSSERSKEGEFERGFRKGSLYLELHRKLFSPESEALAELNRFFEGAFEEPYTLLLADGRQVQSLRPHEHFLYLILHAFKHFVHSGFGLRQVTDIGLWAERYREQIDWELLYEQCEQVSVLHFAGTVLALAERFLGKALRPGRWAELSDDPGPMLHGLLSGGIYGTADGSRLHSAQLTVNEVAADRGQRSSHLREVIFPSREKLLPQFPELKDHPGRLPLVWAKRIHSYIRENLTVDDNNALASLRIARERTELLELYQVISGNK